VKPILVRCMCGRAWAIKGEPCERCKTKAKSKEGKRNEPKRKTACQQGYGYDWQQLSTDVRSEHPYCILCLCRDGRSVAPDLVDHIVPFATVPGRLREHYRCSRPNLQPLCNKCHSEDKRRFDIEHEHDWRSMRRKWIALLNSFTLSAEARWALQRLGLLDEGTGGTQRGGIESLGRGDF